MVTSKESLTINVCPLCHKSHRYEITVKRHPVFFQMTPDSVNMLKPRKIPFTRRFTCPTKGEFFKAKFLMLVDPGFPIDELDVGKLDEDSKEDDPK